MVNPLMSSHSFIILDVVIFMHTIIIVWLQCIVIEAQIPKKADLKRKPSIPFPTTTNTSTDVSLVFGNMTPMIEIPSAIVLRQLEEGI